MMTRPLQHCRKPHSSGTSTSTLKKKIRDVERLLANPKRSLPATVRSENERALEAFKHELKLAQGAVREQKIAKKYHMVRFFERQKATRRLRKLQRELTDSLPETLKTQIHEAEVDLNYILHYPKGEKYISLFKDPGKDSKVSAKRDMIRKDIAKRMERHTLGAVTIGGGKEEEGNEDVVEKKEKRRKKSKKKIQEEKDEDEDEFFEF